MGVSSSCPTKHGRRVRRRAVIAGLGVVMLGAFSGCFPQPRAAVSLRVRRSAKTPHDAAVTIDEQYIGPLYYVARRGVRLPVGEHRITIEKDGYFPWDAIVVADRENIELVVEMVPIPD
jgi:hypothetical protein